MRSHLRGHCLACSIRQEHAQVRPQVGGGAVERGGALKGSDDALGQGFFFLQVFAAMLLPGDAQLDAQQFQEGQQSGPRQRWLLTRDRLGLALEVPAPLPHNLRLLVAQQRQCRRVRCKQILSVGAGIGIPVLDGLCQPAHHSHRPKGHHGGLLRHGLFSASARVDQCAVERKPDADGVAMGS